MAFITAEELKSMPLPVTEKQLEKLDQGSGYMIDFALEAASQHVKNYIERDIEETEYIERIPGKGRPSIMVNNYPLTSVESISGRDVYGYERTYSAEDFLVDADAGIVEFVDKYRNTFVKGWVWEIHYTAGFTTIPYVIKQATALQAINMLQPLFRGGQNFAQVDLVESLDETTVDLLDRYKRVRIG